MTKVVDGLNRAIIFTYDELNRIKTKSYSDGVTANVQYFYDNVPSGGLPPGYSTGNALGRMTAWTTSATSRQTATGMFYRYDIGGRVTASFQLLEGQYFQNVTTYNEGSLPVQESYVNARSEVKNEYNGSGQITAIKVNNNQIISQKLRYTASGAVASQELGNGLNQTISYNSRLQPVNIKLGNSLDGDDQWRLDYSYGVLSSSTQSNQPIDETRNNGNIARIKISPAKNAPPFEQNYEYDELNRLTKAAEYREIILPPIGEIISEACNNDGGGATLKFTDPNNPTTGVLDLSVKIIQGDCVVSGVPDRIVGSGTFSFSYQGDCNGNIGVTNQTGQGNGYNFGKLFENLQSGNLMESQTSPLKVGLSGLEATNEPLQNVVFNDWSQEYCYDRYGNRIGETIDGVAKSIGINSSSNRLTTGYQYDSVGNVVIDNTGQRYQYDQENRLIAVKDSTGRLVSEYYYDGQGRRVKKFVNGQTDNSVTITTLFIYDSDDTLITEYYNVDELSDYERLPARYIYGPLGLQAIINDFGFPTQYLTKDHLGSARVITDDDGRVVNRRDFYPFGEEIANTVNSRGLHEYGFHTDNIRQRFTGYERDDETGLDFAQARYYHAETGRFINTDLLEGNLYNPQSVNQYIYVLNNPLKFTDKMGLAPQDPEEDRLPILVTIQSEPAYKKSPGISVAASVFAGLNLGVTGLLNPFSKGIGAESREDRNLKFIQQANPISGFIGETIGGLLIGGIANRAIESTKIIFIEFAGESGIKGPILNVAREVVQETAEDSVEILSRLGISYESAARLSRKAAEAESVIGLHGVSVSAGVPKMQASQASRDIVETIFTVIDTPSRGDPLHRTIMLPKPVTKEVAEKFNKIFGRKK
jgi:RHS repeat-associated protein